MPLCPSEDVHSALGDSAVWPKGRPRVGIVALERASRRERGGEENAEAVTGGKREASGSQEGQMQRDLFRKGMGRRAELLAESTRD